MFIDFLIFFSASTACLLQLCTEVVMYNERPKMKRDAQQKAVFFPRIMKKLTFCEGSVRIFSFDECLYILFSKLKAVFFTISVHHLVTLNTVAGVGCNDNFLF